MKTKHLMAVAGALMVGTSGAAADVSKSPVLCVPDSWERFNLDYDSVGSGFAAEGEGIIYADEENAIFCIKGAGCVLMTVSSGGDHYTNTAADLSYYGPLTYELENVDEIGHVEFDESSIEYTGSCKSVEVMSLKDVRRESKQ